MPDKPKKIVFIDIDGTLFHPSIGIPETAKNAIKSARENGIKVFLATGRPIYFIGKEILGDSMNVEDTFDGMVCNNGAQCYIGQKPISDNYLDKKSVEELANFLSFHKVGHTIERFNETFMSKDFIEFAKRKREEVLKFEPDSLTAEGIRSGRMHLFRNLDDREPYILENVLKEPIFKVIFASSNKEDNGIEYKDIYAKFKDKFEIFTNTIPVIGKDGGEVAPKGINKATGIKEIAAYYNIDIGKSVAIGDGENDIDMLKFADIGIAMGNSSDNVKKNADFITDSIFDDGLAKAFNKFVL